MTFKTKLAVFVSKIVFRLLRTFKSGATTLPGKIALVIDKNVLSNLAKNHRILAITGTNGKTTTSRMIANILKENNLTFFTNKSGANLLSGITTTFVMNYKNNTDYVLLEIDEAAFSVATNHIKPISVVVTNFYRDQLDRYGELYATLNKVKSGLEKSPKTQIIINGDDSLSSTLIKDLNNPSICYGFSPNIKYESDENNIQDAEYCMYCKNRYKYLNKTIGHLGNFICDNCGYKSPKKTVELISIDELSEDFSKVTIRFEDQNVQVKIALPAIYNIYNALSSLALSYYLKLDIALSTKALSSFECGFGRMEKIQINNKYIKLLLVKNPVGFNSALDYVSKVASNTICFAINDNIADGTDISWLWDVNFEFLLNNYNSERSIICSGKRAYDMALRLKYMNYPEENIIIKQDYKKMIEIGLTKIMEGETFYILPTYTAMLEIRDELNKYGIKEMWE